MEEESVGTQESPRARRGVVSRVVSGIHRQFFLPRQRAATRRQIFVGDNVANAYARGTTAGTWHIFVDDALHVDARTIAALCAILGTPAGCCSRATRHGPPILHAAPDETKVKTAVKRGGEARSGDSGRQAAQVARRAGERRCCTRSRSGVFRRTCGRRGAQWSQNRYFCLSLDTRLYAGHSR